ncbi:MAG: MBOAT family O-acyltransferase [Lachnospiraceae bacterium]|nr:MBOAT family O-acyltransferase [Lachnospiraceae bacterium]
MVFSSLYFLFSFLPLVLCVYFLVPEFLKNIVLLLASIFFYAWGEPVYVVLMLFSAVFNYVIGLDLDRTKGYEKNVLLIFAVGVNLLILGFFKYSGFCIEIINSVFRLSIACRELALPIGISFYTFQSLSYIVDVYRGKVKVQRSLLKFALYLTMFPQLSAGPIVQYSDIEAQLDDHRVTSVRFGKGLDRFIQGLAKKVLLANNLGMIYTDIQGLEQRSVLTAWIGILAYTLQIYFDFSGYSDMAIGLGRMFGFSFNENFRHPYISCSVTEFWRRWHISLSSWFRDYVYIPLGGNRVSLWKHIRNIMIVWMLTGLWHGASWNFVIWGLYYGILLMMEKFLLGERLEGIPQGVRRGITLLLVMIGWVFFSNTNLSDAFSYLRNMVGWGTKGFIDTAALYYLRSNLILLVVGWFAAGPAPGRWFKSLTETKPWLAIAADTALFILCLAYLVYSSYNPFLYFRF